MHALRHRTLIDDAHMTPCCGLLPKLTSSQWHNPHAPHNVRNKTNAAGGERAGRMNANADDDRAPVYTGQPYMESDDSITSRVPYPDRPIPTAHYLLLNLGIAWVTAPLAAMMGRRNLVIGLSFYGLLIINGIVHVGATLVVGLEAGAGVLTVGTVFHSELLLDGLRCPQVRSHEWQGTGVFDLGWRHIARVDPRAIRSAEGRSHRSSRSPYLCRLDGQQALGASFKFLPTTNGVSGALIASLVLGVIWAVFHLVALRQAHHAAGWIGWWSLGTVALRVVLVWLYNNTGRSVFVASLSNMTFNVVWQLFPIHGSFMDQRINGLFWALAATIVVIVWGREHWPKDWGGTLLRTNTINRINPYVRHLSD
jgi:hypothetical protein